MPLAEVRRKNAFTALAEHKPTKSRLSQKVKVASMCDTTNNTSSVLVR